MDISQRQLGEVRGDFIVCLALKLVPDVDVLNANASADNARFSAANTGSALNMFDQCRFHALIISKGRIANKRAAWRSPAGRGRSVPGATQARCDSLEPPNASSARVWLEDRRSRKTEEFTTETQRSQRRLLYF